MKDKRPAKDPYEVRRAAATKALKAFQRQSYREHHSEVIEVLMEESDRGALILVSGILEDLLAEFIIAKLPDGKERQTDLLRFGGVLSSFQDKIAFGRAMGLIDDETVANLDVIRLLRNACAHSIRETTLKTPAINGMFGLLLTAQIADHIKGDVADNYLRVILSLVMVFHVERIRGKSPEAAQVIVDRLSEEMLKVSREIAKQHGASPETQPVQSPRGDPQNREGSGLPLSPQSSRA